MLLFYSRQIYCIDNAHGQLVRDLDFNPNKQYYLASCGDDCKVKFWDTRNINEPVKTLEEHSHWVWSVRYNHSHDQLVLTGSSDSRVILSNMVSISSEPFGHLVDDDDLSDQEDNQQEEKYDLFCFIILCLGFCRSGPIPLRHSAGIKIQASNIESVVVLVKEKVVHGSPTGGPQGLGAALGLSTPANFI
ncbi:hypothetical protein FKM82_011189 [Ascaphus truei]